jgi:predicted DNA-binding transcriptional regulator AlpA
MSDMKYLDKRGVLKIYPSSGSTLDRQMRQEEDPFPAGAIIGGKRYWREGDVLDWLERQFGDRAGNGSQEPPATRGDAEVAETPEPATA